MAGQKHLYEFLMSKTLRQQHNIRPDDFIIFVDGFDVMLLRDLRDLAHDL